MCIYAQVHPIKYTCTIHVHVYVHTLSSSVSHILIISIMAMSLKLEPDTDEETVSSILLQNFTTSLFNLSFSINKNSYD